MSMPCFFKDCPSTLNKYVHSRHSNICKCSRNKQKCSPIQIDMFCKKFRSMLLDRKVVMRTATIGKFSVSFIICINYLLLGVHLRLAGATPILMRHLNNSVLFNLSAYDYKSKN